MSTLKNSGMSIGSYAEQLIMNEMTTPKKALSFVNKTPEVEKQLDISETVVPDEFMNQVLGKKSIPKKQVKQEKKVIVENVEPKQTLLTEEKADVLINLLEEVKTLLEMTGTGCCGCNMGGSMQVAPSGGKKKKSDTVLLFAQKLKGIRNKK